MIEYKWHNDMIDNFYCFDVQGWILSIHPTREGEWLSSASSEGVKKYCQTFKDYQEAKDAALAFALVN